ncbi:MAG TPA: HEAT repeat domain-containing protein [Bryobacteraceae bacterium]|nr:HEAT repeat domain-containing protein [Bryobacteraceae bacterium]
MLNPENYSSTPVYDLLDAAAHGRVGFDKRLVHAIVDRKAEAVPDLLRFGMEEHEDAPLDLEIELINICRHLRIPEVIPFYIECVRRQPDDVLDEIVSAFNEQPDDSLEPLLKLYGELDEEQSGEVAFLLASLRPGDERVLNILLNRLEYDASDGALCLGLYGDPAARPALEKMAADVPPEDHQLRRTFSDALEQLGRSTEPFDSEFDLFEDIPETAGPVMDVLPEDERLEILSSPSPEFRAEAVASFINRDLTPSVRDRIYSLATGDPAPEVRSMAWEALSGEDDKRIRKAMLERLRDASAPSVERLGALVGLAREVGDEKVRPYAEEFYRNPETRAKAMEAMWRSMDRSFAGYFPEHLEDSDGEVKRQAIWGIGYLGIYASAERLPSFFEEEDYRADALFAYALSGRHEITRAHIRGFLRKIEERAAGLSEGETELVQLALDERLVLHGHGPVFFPDAEPSEELVPAGKAGRNDPCPCGSGKKHKKCCGA